MEVPSGTGDFGRFFRLIRYDSNGRYKPELALSNTIGQLISERYKKIERCVEHFSQILNRPVHQTVNPSFSVRLEPYDIN